MNKKIQLFSAVVAAGSLLLLAGCAHYKAKPLPRLDSQKTSDKVTLNHKAFNANDCKTYLGRKNILKKGYQPIQLNIVNNSDHTYNYSPSSFSLPTVPAAFVAHKVCFSVNGRSFGYAAGSAVLAGAALPLAASCIGNYVLCKEPSHTKVSLGAGCLVGATGLGIASMVDKKKSHESNDLLDIDFTAKALPCEGVIRPQQNLNALVFVPNESFSNDFTFTLNNEKSGQALVLKSATSDKVDVK